MDNPKKSSLRLLFHGLKIDSKIRHHKTDDWSNSPVLTTHNPSLAVGSIIGSQFGCLVILLGIVCRRQETGDWKGNCQPQNWEWSGWIDRFPTLESIYSCGERVQMPVEHGLALQRLGMSVVKWHPLLCCICGESRIHDLYMRPEIAIS